MKAIVSQIGKAKTLNSRVRTSQNPSGNLNGPKDNENCGWHPDNEHITIDSHGGAMFEVCKNVLPGSNNHPIKRYEAWLVLKKGVTPVFHKAYDPPHTLKAIFESEINKLVNTGILKPVSQSHWATPVLLVPKRDGSYHMVTNYKATVNPAIRLDHYPIPRVEDIFNSFLGNQVLSVIDLAAAYQQINLHPSCRRLLMINTLKGAF
jgi:hypothetical protein